VSQLRQSNGDDYPDAARKHMEDATVLLTGGRPDGAAYISGYVVECAMKTLIQLETNAPTFSHRLGDLSTTLGTLAAQAGTQTARLYPRLASRLRSAGILGWDPVMRYHGPEYPLGKASSWWQEASDVYSMIVGELALNGAI
jgi:hypothetical protein